MIARHDINIGIDLADERQLEGILSNRAALVRTFTQRELDECLARHDDAIPALARRYAAKEALIKACGRPEGYLARIEILHDADGRPIANWEFLIERGLTARLSLSSAPPFAVAVAVVMRDCEVAR